MSQGKKAATKTASAKSRGSASGKAAKSASGKAAKSASGGTSKESVPGGGDAAPRASEAQHGAVWMDTPEQHDFPAAASYLSLLAPDATVADLTAALQAGTATHFKAKDILRASRLPLLPRDNAHVASDLQKVHHGTPLSPVLLVRGDIRQGVALQVADGFHRVCASYHLDENLDVPAIVVDLPR